MAFLSHCELCRIQSLPGPISSENATSVVWHSVLGHLRGHCLGGHTSLARPPLEQHRERRSRLRVTECIWMVSLLARTS